MAATSLVWIWLPMESLRAVQPTTQQDQSCKVSKIPLPTVLTPVLYISQVGVVVELVDPWTVLYLLEG